jgi:hypothetical protein
MSNMFLHLGYFCGFSKKIKGQLWKRSFIHRLQELAALRIAMIDQVSLPRKVFAKLATCPSSEKLLSFSKSQLSPAPVQFILSHLEECDFCRAELQLLKRFPSQPETIAAGDIPPTLRAFAESILGRSLTSRSVRFPEWPWALSH